MKITKEKVEEVFGMDSVELLELYENSGFDTFEEFFIYSVQNYFNFLELDKDIDQDKKKILENIFNL